uniref:Uncharacterized protein n=1 Tax=Romanomermis culicivorax TaxID=13658 RepID=A0A915KT60_ROMCU
MASYYLAMETHFAMAAMQNDDSSLECGDDLECLLDSVQLQKLRYSHNFQNTFFAKPLELKFCDDVQLTLGNFLSKKTKMHSVNGSRVTYDSVDEIKTNFDYCDIAWWKRLNKFFTPMAFKNQTMDLDMILGTPQGFQRCTFLRRQKLGTSKEPKKQQQRLSVVVALQRP